MAIELQATYSKKLGLPNYSSHCYVVSLRTELTDLSQVEAESTRLYSLLQQSVDREVQEVGYLPDVTTYGRIKGSLSSAPMATGMARTATHTHATATVSNPSPQPKATKMIPKQRGTARTISAN